MSLGCIEGSSCHDVSVRITTPVVPIPSLGVAEVGIWNFATAAYSFEEHDGIFKVHTCTPEGLGDFYSKYGIFSDAMSCV